MSRATMTTSKFARHGRWRAESHVLSLARLILFATVVGAPGHSAAQYSPESDRPRSETDIGDRTARAGQAGMFLPLSDAPRTDTQRALATTQSGYDGARKAGVFEGRAEATVYGPIAVRFAAIYSPAPEDRVRPIVGARIQALSQGHQGIDMSIGAFYKAEGFTEAEGEIETVVALGWRSGPAGVIGNVVYGQDPEGRERDGELRIAGLYALQPRLVLGLDSRLRFDLGTNADKLGAEGGAHYDSVTGPLISYTLGPVALGALAGVSAVGTPKTMAGPIVLASFSGTL